MYTYFIYYVFHPYFNVRTLWFSYSCNTSLNCLFSRVVLACLMLIVWISNNDIAYFSRIFNEIERKMNKIKCWKWKRKKNREKLTFIAKDANNTAIRFTILFRLVFIIILNVVHHWIMQLPMIQTHTPSKK